MAAIQDFERLPITSVTPAQGAEETADINKVNAFFDLPTTGLVPPCGIASAPGAAAAWTSEPPNTTEGILVGPLQRAVSVLAKDASTDPCIPAAIADLENLESATAADVAASAGETTGGKSNLFGADIAYLNDFFQSQVLTSG
jgi:hypothetical protein